MTQESPFRDYDSPIPRLILSSLVALTLLSRCDRQPATPGLLCDSAWTVSKLSSDYKQPISQLECIPVRHLELDSGHGIRGAPVRPVRCQTATLSQPRCLIHLSRHDLVE